MFYHIDLCIAITTCDTDEVLQFKIALEWLMNKMRALQRLKGWCDATRNYTNILQLPTVHNFLSHNNDVILSATLSFRSIAYRSVVILKKSPAKVPVGTSTGLTSNLTDRAKFPLCQQKRFNTCGIKPLLFLWGGIRDLNP